MVKGFLEAHVADYLKNQLIYEQNINNYKIENND